ncbi:ATP-binding cassette domain-containing protein, partial [Fusobacterium ulcerans]|uniref:ATP-binding cassette domain-containing protein n=1 Tax=Fusobacterium ulcerans TaxID=861 RepID=UPI0026E9F6D8
MVIALNNMYRVLNLKKIFEISKNEKIIFENMNLEIDNDKITVVLGKSGCGKTTLLRMIAGLEEITYGSIDFYNKSGEKVKAKIGMVFQESRLMPWLTVKENILLPAELDNRKIDKEYLEDLLKTLDLKE